MAEQVLGGRYRIDRHIARGGMAEVYLAHDQLLDRPVAVKVLFPELARDPAFVERFRREAQSAARLNHPNIVSVYDFGEDGEAFYIVMEYIAGQTLSDIIVAEGPMAPTRAISIAADIGAGLAAAHGEGIVHRDVKPANVLIAAGVAKVADFGIARAADARVDLTLPGAVLGTATYLSPEQAQGFVVDQRSDLYSLGMVLYEMLTGRAPFRGDNPVTVAYKQQHEVPPPPSTVNEAVPPQLDAIIARAMSLDPADRQRSAGELRAQLLAVGPGPVGAEPTAAFGPAATAVFPAAGGAPGTAGAGGAAALPRARVGEGGEGAGSRPPRRMSPGEYGRRRVVALGLLVVLVLGVIVTALALRSSGTSTTIVPHVIGLSVADATAALGRAGLKSTVLEQNRLGPPGQVADQLPVAQMRVQRNTIVSLFVPSATTTTRAPVSNTRPTTRATTTTSNVSPTTPAPATTSAVTTVPGTTPAVTTTPPLTTTNP